MSDPDYNTLPTGALALVTGATGFTGSHLVRLLAGQGVRIRAIARASSSVDALSDLGIEWVRGEVHDADVVRRAADGVDYIFHLAAAYRAYGLPDTFYRDVHVTSTRRLAEAALANPGFRRFVHVSTVGVHSHIEEGPADETYRFAPDDIYQVTKADAELWIREFAPAHRLPFTVVRPAAILGPGDRRLLKFFKMAARPFLPLLGPAGLHYHLVHVEDLCRMMIRTAVHPDALGEVFICGNAEAIRYDEMGRVIARALGRSTRVIRLPAGPFFLAAGCCEAVCKAFRIPPPVSRRRIAFFTKNREFNTRKIRERLGYEMRYSNETGLQATAAWYRDQGWL